MRSSGLRDRARTGALALVVFALAHNLIFLATYGGAGGQALVRTGHGPQWTATVTLIAILAVALAVAGAFRLNQLSRLAHRLSGGAITVESGGLRDLSRDVGRAWLQILASAAVLFVAAENLERVAAGLTAPGLGVFGSAEYHAVLAIFGATALLAALIDALYRWRRDLLITTIEAAHTRWARAGRSVRLREMAWVDRRHGAIARHQIAGRAPPRATPD